MVFRRFYHPYEELKELTSEMDIILESIFGPSFQKRRKALPGQRTEEGLVKISPPIELLEEEGNFVVKLEIPGVSPEEVEVLITPEQLTVKGEFKNKKETEKKEFQYSEFSYGAFARTITFPNRIDDSQATATFKNGILTVKAPRVKEVLLEGRKLIIE